MRERNLLAAALVLAVVVLLAGCGKSGGQRSAPVLAGPVLASVDGDKLTKAEFDSVFSKGDKVAPDSLQRLLDNWVSLTLLYREALRRGIGKEAKVQMFLKLLERQSLVGVLGDRLTSSVTVGQDQVWQYFTQHKDDFSSDVKIARIVLPDSLAAVQTLAELKGGADFKKLAEERSVDQMFPGGRETPYMSRTDIRDPAAADEIFALSPGQFSDVMPGPDGYQVIKLVDKKKTRADVSFAEAKDGIEEFLKYRRGQALVDSVLTSLREKAKIELKPDAYFESAGK